MDDDFVGMFQNEEGVKTFGEESAKKGTVASFQILDIPEGDGEQKAEPGSTDVSRSAESGENRDYGDDQGSKYADMTPVQEPEQTSVEESAPTPVQMSEQTSAQAPELLERLDSLAERIESLQGDLETVRKGMTEIQGYKEAVGQLKMSLSRNQQNEDRIYKELETAKKDQYFTFVRPFLEYMVSQHIDLCSSRKQYEDDKEAVIREYGEAAYQELIKLHDFQIESIEGQFQIQGIEMKEYLPDSDYNAMEQMLSKTLIPTEKEEQNGKVAQTESPCYVYMDKTLRKARVALYKYSK